MKAARNPEFFNFFKLELRVLGVFVVIPSPRVLLPLRALPKETNWSGELISLSFLPRM